MTKTPPIHFTVFRSYELVRQYISPNPTAHVEVDNLPTITLLPEYHLTGFSQDKAIMQPQAAEMASALPGKVVVAGYVEKHGSNYYSSAIVVEKNGSVYNVRKSEPWGKTEKNLGSQGATVPLLCLSFL